MKHRNPGRRGALPLFSIVFFALFTFFATAALAGPPVCGDNVCGGGETCDGTTFCKSTNCPAGTAPVCDATCGGYTCQPTGGGGGSVVDVWVTAGDQSQLLASQPSVNFGADTTQGLLVHVNENDTYQEIEGFGAALSDSSAWLMWNAQSPSQRAALLDQLFGPNGARLNWVRLPMGASDFALNHYTYNDMPAGQTDPTLANFSIAHDQAYIIPVLQEILAINPDVKIVAVPWSAPGWMKNSDSLVGGELLAQYQQTYADYFVRFLQDYAAAGIVIDAVSPQNEPYHDAFDYPGMRMEPEQQVDFVGNDLGPAIAAAGLSTRILAWDHNWDQPYYSTELLLDPVAGQYTDGTAFHCYAGEVRFQTLTHDLAPNAPIFMTECSSGAWSPNWSNNLLWDANTLIVDNIRNWGSAAIKWNLALDENYGPHTGGCGDCTGVVTINSTSGAVTYNHDFYALGQASRFVDPGAVRIASDTFEPNSIRIVAFKNPDGTKVLLAANDANNNQTFKVRWGGESFQYTLLKKSVTTFKWSGTQGEPTAPDTPANVTAKADHDSVRLSWDFVYLAASYTVERAPAGGSFSTLASGVGTSSYDDTSAVAGTAYDYRVTAENAAGSSAASSVVSGTAGARDAFSQIEAEDFANQHGLGVESNSDSNSNGLNIANTDQDDYLVFPGVDFGNGIEAFNVRIATAQSGGRIEARLDDPNGPLLSDMTVTSTGGWSSFQTRSEAASGASGVQDLVLVFRDLNGVGNVNWFDFTPCTSCSSCTVDADCDDGLFCNGAETCNAGSCSPGSDPCPLSSCDEAGDTCVSCGAVGSGCTADSDCCSLRCRGKNGAKTCQ